MVQAIGNKVIHAYNPLLRKDLQTLANVRLTWQVTSCLYRDRQLPRLHESNVLKLCTADLSLEDEVCHAAV